MDENETVRSQVRLPVDLWDWLKVKAKRENRSLNGQIAEIIKEARQRDENEVHP